MGKEHEHYSDKGAHKLRSDYWKELRRHASQRQMDNQGIESCGVGECDTCPVALDCDSVLDNDRTIFKRRPEDLDTRQRGGEKLGERNST